MTNIVQYKTVKRGKKTIVSHVLLTILAFIMCGISDCPSASEVVETSIDRTMLKGDEMFQSVCSMSKDDCHTHVWGKAVETRDPSCDIMVIEKDQSTIPPLKITRLKACYKKTVSCLVSGCPASHSTKIYRDLN